MVKLDLTLPSPQENLALDEALLELCDTGAQGEVLRFWESPQHFVVVGYANRVDTEVNTRFCREHSLPILRRCTGGGTVLQGPGVLNYALVLRLDRAPGLQSIPGTNNYVLEKHARVFSTLLGGPVKKEGHTDLVLNDLKFSGNAQRRRRKALLFHGSFLLDLNLNLLEQALPLPSRQPDYRLNRSHRDFLINLGLSQLSIKQGLARAWEAAERMPEIPLDRVSALVVEKYSRPDWNLKF
jgi:lipoate---protein ligase